MDQQGISSRSVIGMYYMRLEQNPGLAWVDGVSNLFNSDQASETYPFLGQSPVMREWVQSRQAHSLRENGLIVINKHYESTLEISKKDAQRDKTGQIIARVNEWVDKSLSHWATLLTSLISAGDSTVCYDGQYYFDTDHSEGDSGVQSNKIEVDISALPAKIHGSVTVPSVEEMQQAIIAGIVAILKLKDDKGEPLNENAAQFLVMVPIGLYTIAAAAVSTIATANLENNFNPNLIAGLSIRIQMNARLSWTDTFAVFRTDSPIKGLIRQTEQEVELKAKAEGSEFEFDNDAWQFGIDAWRGVGYGYWQRACRVTMI